MGLIQLKNKKGTADRTPPFGYSSWLDFWEKKSGSRAITCEVSGCYSRAEVGGHVIRSGGSGKEYILPMCKGCNNKSDYETFYADNSKLVPVTS